jgi:hypothetical protein
MLYAAANPSSRTYYLPESCAVLVRELTAPHHWKS